MEYSIHFDEASSTTEEPFAFRSSHREIENLLCMYPSILYLIRSHTPSQSIVMNQGVYTPFLD